MSLDQLASAAARELLDRTTPDVAARLDDLPRLRRRRASERALAVVVAVAAVLTGAWLSAHDAPAGVDAVDRSGSPRNGALVGLSLDGGSLVLVDGRLAHHPEDLAPFSPLDFTADGHTLMYADRHERFVALDVVTGSTRVVADCAPGFCEGAISPDGTRVAVSTPEGLRVHEVGGGSTALPGVRGLRPTWSPDGSRIAFSDVDRLVVVDADGSDARTLWEGAGLVASSWSPDGRQLAFVAPESTGISAGPDLPLLHFTLRVIDADGGPARVIQDLGECACLGVSAPTVAWSPDGTLIAFTRIDSAPRDELGAARSDGVWTVAPDGSGLTQLVTVAEGELAWQPLP